MVALKQAVVAGYGLSAGRDAWQLTKKNAGWIVLLVATGGAVYLPFKGGRELTRWHERSVLGTILKTVAGSFLLIAAGTVLGNIIVGLALIILADNGNGALGLTLLTVGCSTTAALLAGMLTGLFERRGRKQKFAVRQENGRFLESIGFKVTGGRDVTHYDADGNALRFLEAHDDRLVFLPIGRRNKRAYIVLHTDGRMTSYSGITNL